MKKKINRFIYIIINLIIIYGFVAPYLISAKNNELVALGFGISLLNTYHLGTFIFLKNMAYEPLL